MVSQPFSSSSGSYFSASAGSSSSSTSSSSAHMTTSLFSYASAPSTPSIFSPTFGSSAAPSTVFTFGQSSSASASSPCSSAAPSTVFTFGQSSSASVSSPFSFAAPPSSLFSFTAASAAVNATLPQPMFGMPTPNAGFGSGSPGNDPMNVDVSMADDSSQPVVPPFGQSGSSPATPLFGAPATPSTGPSIFQFGGLQNPAPQSQSPFQASGNLEVPPGGGFSMGSLGGDKSGKRIVKVRREAL